MAQNQTLSITISGGNEEGFAPTDLSVEQEISNEFIMNLYAFCEQTPPPDPKQFVGQTLNVNLSIDGNTEQFFNGIILDASRAKTNNDGALRYHFVAYPWLSALKYSADSRVFQKKTTQEILQEIFDEAGFSDFKFNIKTGEPHVYKIQYNETNYEFVHRLMASEGLYYFFQHEDGKHTMIINDSSAQLSENDSAPKFVHGASSSQFPELQGLSQTRRFRTGDMSLAAYSYVESDPNLMQNAPIDSSTPVSAEGPLDETKFKTYLHTDDYKKPDNGLEKATTRLQQLRQGSAVMSAYSTDGAINIGQTFEIDSRADISELESKKYTATKVVVKASDYSVHQNLGKGLQNNYRVDVEGFPDTVAIRGKWTKPKPVMVGSQVAVVVGSDPDKPHLDAMGRIKVQFHWDRVGSKDDNSSCFLRLSQLWAGSGMGSFFYPRPNTEVLVTFLGGDPDQPIITGCLYDKNIETPYSFPDEDFRSGFRTKSIGGDADAYNELSFSDKNGEEEVLLQAQKDFNANVKNDSTATIGQNSAITIGANLTQSIEGEHKETIKGTETREIEGEQKITVNADSTVQTKNNNLKVDGAQKITVTGLSQLTADGAITIKSSDAIKADSSSDYTVKSAANVTVEASSKMTLKAGSSEIVLDASGVTITTAGNITIDGMMVKAGKQVSMG